jgi:cytochrome c oxidase subunit 4
MKKADKRSNEVIEENQEYTISYRQLSVVLGALLTLTALTVAVSRINLGYMKIWISLLIAAAKGTLVLLFFMQIRSVGKAVSVTFIVTLVILALFIGLIFFDIDFR